MLTTIAAVVLVGCWNSEADRALFTAVQVESIQAVEQAIAAGADVNAKDDSKITPLLWAINNSHKEIVELLITKGADVNFKDIAGQTPLDWAESRYIHRNRRPPLQARSQDRCRTGNCWQLNQLASAATVKTGLKTGIVVAIVCFSSSSA